MKALILGSSSSMGKAIVNTMRKKGYGLILHKRSKGNEISSDSSKYIYGDICSNKFPDEIERCLRLEKPNIYINCCAIHSAEHFRTIDDQTIRKVIETNITAPTIILTRIYSYFMDNSEGIIVNIGSIASSYDCAGESIYSMTKSAMNKLHNCIRLEALESSVRVINFNSGAFKSSMVKSRKTYQSLPDPDELASVICTLIELKEFNVNEIEIRRI